MSDKLDGLRAAKSVARNPYAWPGGYPRFLVMSDGECLCPACVKTEFRQIADSTFRGHHDGWKAAADDINWEDSTLHCAHCGNRIESAYGEESANA